jgi:hypothetical protein
MKLVELHVMPMDPVHITKKEDRKENARKLEYFCNELAMRNKNKKKVTITTPLDSSKYGKEKKKKRQA